MDEISGSGQNREAKERVGKMIDERKPDSIGRFFCVLEYIAREVHRASGNDPKIIALVTSSGDNEAGIRVHPEWEKIVQLHDREYLKSLYRDFNHRIKVDPDAFFRQLSNLGVGPLIARHTGSDLNEYPAYRRLMYRFRKL